MSDSPVHTVRRLLVALDAMCCGAGDCDAAIDLAALIGAELSGLLVQDADLLRLASLPIAHEVGRLSGQPRPLARESLESVLQRRAERAAAALERAAKSRNVTVTHTISRGKLVRQALERGEHGDVVFLLGRRAYGEVARAPARRRMMVWYDDPTATPSIELALDLSRRTGAQLLVGFPSTLFASEAELRAHLGTLLDRMANPIRVVALSDAGIGTILEAARHARVTRIIFGVGSKLIDADAIELMFGTFQGDLILVR